MKRTLIAIAAYLKDWKNLLTHGLIGVGIILLALFLPVSAYWRGGILVAVVGFNIARMRLSKRREALRKAPSSPGASS